MEYLLPRCAWQESYWYRCSLATNHAFDRTFQYRHRAPDSAWSWGTTSYTDRVDSRDNRQRSVYNMVYWYASIRMGDYTACHRVRTGNDTDRD